MGVILAEREPFPLIVQQETAHIRVIDKADTEQGIHLTLVQLSGLIQIGYGIQQGVNTVGRRCNHNDFTGEIGRG